MKKFEYEVAYAGNLVNAEAVRTMLNEMGGDGWECFTVTKDENFRDFFFKREIKDA